MSYSEIRKVLHEYYFKALPRRAEEIRNEVFSALDAYAASHPEENAYQYKARQYAVITEALRPRLFRGLPFFFETGALHPWSDGRYDRGALHANAWLYCRNHHLFRDTDPYAYDLYQAQLRHWLYSQCGTYADMMHQGLPLKKVFAKGLSGILAEIDEAEEKAEGEERDFLFCARAGILALCRIAERFALEAEEEGGAEIAALARRVPLDPPKTYHEGLCVLAFLRKALGSLEGMGYSSFGRVDLLLAPLYERDLARGVSRDALLDLTTRFLLIWDCTMNREVRLEKGAEYELENSLTLGGCDRNGAPVYNGVTDLFLEARDRESILYPKMMLRYSDTSPEEYLRKISSPLLRRRSFSLYANDAKMIDALIASGIEAEDARDYCLGGCWDVLLPDLYFHNAGEYFSLLTPLMWSIHRMEQGMRESNLYFEALEDCESFEELYRRYLGGIRRIAASKSVLQSRGARVWHRVNPLGATSALMEPCLPKKRDITHGAGKYNAEVAYFVLFAETVDSLLAIRKLCFEEKLCTVGELFDACRGDFPDEVLRQRALRAPHYGDGSEEAALFVGQFVNDVSELFGDLPTAYGGRVRLGANHYTEIVGMRNNIPAMPSGRRRGDFLSQGLTPSRTGRGAALTDILYGLHHTDLRKLAAYASLTLTLPVGKMKEEDAVSFFRMTSRAGVLSIQPNFIDREELLRAEENPEAYGHIIVRVCGFSAPFVLLPPIYQKEILSRTEAEI